MEVCESASGFVTKGTSNRIIICARGRNRWDNPRVSYLLADMSWLKSCCVYHEFTLQLAAWMQVCLFFCLVFYVWHLPFFRSSQWGKRRVTAESDDRLQERSDGLPCLFSCGIIACTLWSQDLCICHLATNLLPGYNTLFLISIWSNRTKVERLVSFQEGGDSAAWCQHSKQITGLWGHLGKEGQFSRSFNRLFWG